MSRPPLTWSRQTTIWAGVAGLVVVVATGLVAVDDWPSDVGPPPQVAASDPSTAPPGGPADPGQPSGPSESAGPTEPEPEPHEPAGAVLDPLADAPSPSADGVAARLRPLLSAATLGSSVSAAVLDPLSDTLLLDVDADGANVPASTTKLLTGLAALEALGPDTRFTTSVVRTGSEVVLVGGGDPALSQRTGLDERWVYAITRLDVLAADTAAALLAAGTTMVRLGYSDALFTGPAVSPTWEPAYVPSGEVAPVTALSLDGGRERPGFAKRAADPSRYAAERFAALLVAAGVQVEGAPTARDTSVGPVVATISSPTVAELVGQMLARSDNDVAEMLARHVARAEGLAPTFGGGGQAIAAVLDRLGVPSAGLDLSDGSGLSRENRISAVTLVRALELGYEDEDGSTRALLTGLPVAGFTGTLGSRFTDAESVGAAGDVRAKTGYLTGVVSLAGYLVDADGRALVFAVLADAVPPTAVLDAQQAEDRFAARLAACGCR